MITVGIFAAIALGLARAVARCPLGRALAAGMRSLEDAHTDLHQ